MEENSDKDEGRGRPYISHVCLDRSTAALMAKGQGTFGSDAKVTEIPVIKAESGVYRVGDTINQVWPETQEDKIKKAKAKLTQEELEVLGLV